MFALANVGRKSRATRISCHAALDRSTCAPVREERRMHCINATKSNRKSGGSPSNAFSRSGYGCSSRAKPRDLQFYGPVGKSFSVFRPEHSVVERSAVLLVLTHPLKPLRPLFDVSKFFNELQRQDTSASRGIPSFAKSAKDGHPYGCCPQNTYETPINGEGLKCRPASFKRKRTLPVTSSLAAGLTLAPNEMFAWFTVEVKVETLAWGWFL